jgi:hypothetical protein
MVAMAVSRRSLLLLLGLLAVLTVGLRRPTVSVPGVRLVRSRQEDQRLLVQKGSDQWLAAPMKGIRQGQEATFIPSLIFTRGGPGSIMVVFPGHEEFLKRSRVNGVLCVGWHDRKGGRWMLFYYSLEQHCQVKYLVLPDEKGGVVRFTYELTDGRLTLKGTEPPGVFPYQLSRDYERK